MKIEEFHENELNLGKMRKWRPGGPRGGPRGSQKGTLFIIIELLLEQEDHHFPHLASIHQRRFEKKEGNVSKY